MQSNRCLYCNKDISGEYYVDWNDNKVCVNHFSFVQRCSCCLQYIVSGYEVEPDRYICPNCLSNEISKHNIVEHIDRVYSILYEKGFNDIQRDHITIELVSKARMRELYQELDAAGLHSGYSNIWNEQGRTGFNQKIYVLDHQHYIEFEAILAHELIHGWQLQQNIDDYNRQSAENDESSKARTEGFAQLGSYLIYKRRFEEAKILYESPKNSIEKDTARIIMRLCRYHLKIAKESNDPMYGVAFNKILEHKRKVGWLEIIREARMDELKKYV